MIEAVVPEGPVGASRDTHRDGGLVGGGGGAHSDLLVVGAQCETCLVITFSHRKSHELDFLCSTIMFQILIIASFSIVS